MGSGDLSTVAHVYPALSTVRINGITIGAKAAEALLARFAADPRAEIMRTEVKIDTGFTIIDRQST